MIHHSDFRPAWWLPGPHAQTIWSSLFRRKEMPERRRERIDLSDGDFVDLDWAECAQESNTTVVILHGLTGSSDSNYAWGLQAALLERNWQSVVLNFRGCSGEPNRLPRAYHSGETGDVGEVMQHVRTRCPNHALCAVGYSLGGNVLLKWLGEKGGQAGVAAAVAISVPYLLDQCQQRLNRGFSRVYQRRLVGQLKASVAAKKQAFHREQKQHHLTALQELGNVSEYRTFLEFDEHVTAPLHGFRGAAEYYRLSSSRPFLQQIRVPTLLLHAVDDPFVAHSAIPEPEHLSDHVTLELSRAGGHVGFVSGSNPMRPEYWLEKRIPEFLGQQLRPVA